jgi:2'-5' RNA ligase
MESWEDWQKPYIYGTFAIWPPDEVREIVDAQRQAYDPVSQAICGTHITVTQPMIKPLGEGEWKRLQIVLREFVSFEIEYGPVKSFLPYPCIWYEVQPAERILEIRTALHDTGYFNLTMQHPEDFIPHMTITEGLSGPEVNEGLLVRLQQESKPGTFICDTLVYIVPDDHFQFQVRRSLPLS